MNEMLLEVKNLQTCFFTPTGVGRAVDGVSLSIKKGRSLGLVGESGCGKTVTARSIMRLIREPGRITAGEVLLKGENLLNKSEEEMRRIRGKEISMIFQDPTSSLNPVFTVGEQVSEAFRAHRNLPEQKMVFEEILNYLSPISLKNMKRYWEEALKMLKIVNLPNPPERASDYPHQFSGGMRQRIMITIALSCQPALLIADEPTTALDVTIQAQINQLLKELQQRFNTAILLITHDLGIVAEFCNEVSVMYAGQIVEHADVDSLFSRPTHPYTVGLLHCLPTLERRKEWLASIPGSVPDIVRIPLGCRFHPRCKKAKSICREQEPPMKLVDKRKIRCHLI